MCPDCEARRKLARDAFLKARVGEAAAQVAKGMAEAVGLKEKTGSADLKEKQAFKKPGVLLAAAQIGHNPQE